MIRRALLAPLLAWLAACTVAGPRPEGAPAPPVRVPEAASGVPDVRVGLSVDVPAVRVASDARLEVVDEGGRVLGAGSGPWTVTRSEDGVRAAAGSTVLGGTGSLIFRPSGGAVRVDGTAYGGTVLVRPAVTGVTAVNLLDLETYLRGVVPLEIGKGRRAYELAAVKAQAVAARTYAVRALGRRDDLGFDFYGSVLDQAYGGDDAEDPLASRAVAETRGEILTYEGRPIEAYYHSTCGGRTAALEEVWSGEPRPYLRSVSDRTPGGGAYCEASSRYRWTEAWGESALLRALNAGLRDRVGERITRVESMRITDRTESGRAGELVVRTNAGEVRVRGDSIRRVLLPEPGRLLNSTRIELRPHGDGPVVGLTVDGSGWGHGIGMCQMGALGRARAGHSYREILSTYYPGTRLTRLYR